MIKPLHSMNVSICLVVLHISNVTKRLQYKSKLCENIMHRFRKFPCTSSHLNYLEEFCRFYHCQIHRVLQTNQVRGTTFSTFVERP